MKTTVIFDLDGLLIDSEIIAYQVYCDLTGKYGHSFAVEEYTRDYSGKTEVANLKRIISTYQLPISMEDGLVFVENQEKFYLEKGVALKPGAEELLKYLRKNGYKIVLATSSTRERAEGILIQNRILDYFDHMVFCTEVSHGKPAPDIFLKACEKAGETAANCLVLEDSEAGIQAGYSAGIDVICVPDMKKPGEEFRNMAADILPSLTEVAGWLEERK